MNSDDHDQTPHYLLSNLGLHYLAMSHRKMNYIGLYGLRINILGIFVFLQLCIINIVINENINDITFLFDYMYLCPVKMLICNKYSVLAPSRPMHFL